MGMSLLKSYKSGFILAIMIGGMACAADPTPPSHEPDIPHLVWKTRLPGDAGTYNDGLVGLPLVDNKVLFHSTIFTNKYQEDNRIHALNVETGELIWTYPREYSPDNPCFFGGKPYIQDQTMVVKMSAFDPYCDHDRILIMDISTGKQQSVLHLPVSLSNFSCPDIVGIDNAAWFTQEDTYTSSIYKIDLLSGDTTRVATLRSSDPDGRIEISNRELHLYDYYGHKCLLLGLTDFTPDTIKCRVALVSVETGDLIYTREIEADLLFPVNYLQLRDSLLYYTSGRNSGCLNVNTNSMVWENIQEGSFDSILPGLHIQGDVVFLWGHAGCAAYHAFSGKLLYTLPVECANVNGISPYIVLIERDGTTSIREELTGKIVKKLKVDKVNVEINGFSYSCKPGIYGSQVFLFGTYFAYCFKIA